MSFHGHKQKCRVIPIENPCCVQIIQETAFTNWQYHIEIIITCESNTIAHTLKNQKERFEKFRI